MKTIKVLSAGIGCAKCETTIELIKKVLLEHGKNYDVLKVNDMQELIRFKIMATPGVVVDDVLVHSGSVPSEAEVLNWL